MSYLPDRVSVFACLGGALEDRLILPDGHIEDPHGPVIEPHTHQVGVLGVDV